MPRHLPVELDAADQFAADDALAMANGLGSAIASLELPMSPNSVEVVARRVTLALGEVQVSSLEVPINAAGAASVSRYGDINHTEDRSTSEVPG